MREDYERSLEVPRAIRSIAGSVALLVLLLSSLGLFGVAAHAASARTKDIGIRLALGATAGAAVRGLLRPMLWAGVAGAAVGLFGGALLTRAVAGPPFHIDAGDPAAYGGAAGVLLVAGASALFTPVWRVLRTNPLRALRQE
jgi:ABC-type antimicrobial peptide transport system permease subunit